MKDSSDLFYQEPKKEKEILEQIKIPGNYTEVKLSSLGKLGVPRKIHVRNYSFEEALEMAEMNKTNERSIILRVLDAIILEDFEPGDLHEQDVIEILLNVFAKWWSPTLEGFKYLVNEDLPKEEMETKENVSIAELPISSINTIPLKKEVKEPFKITGNGTVAEFITPKMKTGMIAKTLSDEKYEEEEERFNSLLDAVRKGEPYSMAEMKSYSELQAKKQKDYLRYYQAQLITSVDGVPITKIEQGLELLKEMDLKIWTQYNKVLEENFKFGIDENVKFKCTVTGNEITRRFHFRTVDFLPSVESENDTGYSVSFG